VKIQPLAERDPKPTLMLMAGLPYSGKSTLAREMDAPIVNPDAIRVALHGQRYAQTAEPMVWAIAQYMVRSLFLAGHDHVIVDACNATRRRMSEWLSSDWKLEAVLLPEPPEVCRSRAIAAGDDAILPVIDRMAQAWDHGAFEKDTSYPLTISPAEPTT